MKIELRYDIKNTIDSPLQNKLFGVNNSYFSLLYISFKFFSGIGEEKISQYYTYKLMEREHY